MKKVLNDRMLSFLYDESELNGFSDDSDAVEIWLYVRNKLQLVGLRKLCYNHIKGNDIGF